MTDANTVDEQRERAALGIEGAQHVDDVVASPGWGRPIGSLRKIAHNAVEHAIQRVGTQAQRRRVPRLHQATRAEQDLQNGLEGAVIQQYRGILPGQETGHHHARRIRVQ